MLAYGAPSSAAARSLPVRLPILPEEFRAAHSRLASADLVLHGVLAKIAGMRSHEPYLDSGRGKSSLNYLVAAVAPVRDR